MPSTLQAACSRGPLWACAGQMSPGTETSSHFWAYVPPEVPAVLPDHWGAWGLGRLRCPWKAVSGMTTLPRGGPCSAPTGAAYLGGNGCSLGPGGGDSRLPPVLVQHVVCRHEDRLGGTGVGASKAHPRRRAEPSRPGWGGPGWAVQPLATAPGPSRSAPGGAAPPPLPRAGRRLGREPSSP